MKQNKFIPAIAAVLAAVFVAAIASAQSVGIGINKDTTLQGAGSSGSKLGVNTTTLAGSGLDKTSTTLLVGQGSGITVSADAVRIDPTYTQRRVTGTCGAGSAVTAIAEAGTVTCGAAGSTYTAGDGLSLTVDDFDVVTGTGITITADAVTANLTGASCSAGSFMSALGATGTGTCTSAISGTSGRSTRFSSATAIGNGAWTDDGTNATANGNTNLAAGTATLGKIKGTWQTTSVSGTQNNFVINDTTTTLLWSTVTANVTFTGFKCGASDCSSADDGRIIIVLADGTGSNNLLVINEESASSTAANRIRTLGGSLIVRSGGSSTGTSAVWFQYDGSVSRWRLVNLNTTRHEQITQFDASTTFTANMASQAQTTLASIIDTPTTVSTFAADAEINLGTGGNYRVDCAGFYITGMVTGAAGRRVRIENISTTTNCLIPDEGNSHATASTAVARFSHNSGQGFSNYYVLGPRSSVTATYDGTISRWVLDDSAGQLYGLNVVAGSTFGGNLDIQSTAHVKATGTDPTLSSCGTSPTVVGSDVAGTVTIGTGGSATACTVTFAATYTTAPACVVTSLMSARTDLYISAISATAFTLSNGAGAAWPASGQFTYQCTGF